MGRLPNMFSQPVCDIITFQKHLINTSYSTEGLGKLMAAPHRQVIVSVVTGI